MADEVAKTSLVFDASGAQKGAAEFDAAATKVVQAEEKVQAARVKGTKAARESAEVQASAAKAGAESVAESLDRIVRSHSRMVSTLDRYAKAWDPLNAAAGRAGKQLEAIWDIAQKSKGEVQVQALGLMTEAVNRLNTATRNFAAGFDIDKRVAELTARFDPATASARAMTAELKDLNDAQKLGIVTGLNYAAQQEKIIEKYNEGAQSAAKLAAAQRAMIEEARAAQQAQNAQTAVSDPRTILGLEPLSKGGAAASASVFVETAEALEEVDKSSAASVRRMAELTAKFDPATASAREMTARLRELNEAQRLGVNIAGGYTAAFNAIVESYDESAQAAQRSAAAARKAAEEQRAMIEAARAAQQAQNAQTAHSDPRTILGLGPISKGGAASSASVFEETAQAQEALAKTMDQMTATFRPAVAAAEAYAASLKELDAAVHLLDLDEKEAAAAREQLDRSYANVQKRLRDQAAGLKSYGDSAFAARFATQQLGVQTVQFFSALEAGQPFWQAFIGQAHQVADVAIATNTGFKTLASGIGSMFAAAGRWVVNNPIVAGLAAITAGVVGLGVVAESAARRMEASRNVLSGVRSDYMAASAAAEELAKSLAKTTTLSTGQSREASQTLFAGGFKGTIDEGKAVVQIFADLSKVLGETEPNFKRLAEAMQDPAAVMQTLLDQNHLAGLDQKLVNAAKHMQEEGNFAGAAALLMKSLAAATVNVKDNLTPLEKAVHDLGVEFNTAWTNGKSFAEVIGGGITSQLAEVISNVTKMIHSIKEMITWLDQNTPDWVKTVATAKIPSPGDLAGGWLHSKLSGEGGGSSAAPGSAAGDFTSSLAPALQQQLNAPGAVKTVLSSAGAMGIMQLMPDTARGLGVNPFVPNENVRGGMLNIQQLAGQMASFPGGVETGIARAYLKGPHGNLMAGDATEYADKVASADISKLPTETAAMIDYWGKVLNMPPNLIALGKRIAVVEHAGSQGPINAKEAFVTPGGADFVGPPAPASVLAGNAAPKLPTGNDMQKIIKEAEDYTGSLGLLGDKQNTITRQQNVLTLAIKQAAEAGDTNSAAVQRWKTALLALQGQMYDAIGPQQEFIRTLKLQAETAQVVTEGDRKMAEALQQLNELNKQHPDTANDNQRSQVINAVLEQQSGLYKQLVHDTDLQTEQQDALTAAYGKGYVAVQQVTAATQAYNDAIKLFPAGTQRQAAIEALTQKNIEHAQSQARLQIAPQLLANDNQVQLLKAETAALYMDDNARAAYLARVQAEIQLKTQGLPINDAFAQSYITSAQKVAAANVAFQRQRAAMAELEQTFDKIGDTIEHALTDPLKEGETAATRFRDVMISVLNDIEKEFLKLAVINPIKNALFGRSTDRPELGDFGGGGAGTGGTGTGAGGGGLLGSGVNSVFGSGFYQGGGLIGSYFGSGAAGAGAAGGFSNAALLAGEVGLYHAGGLVGAGPASSRAADPMIFAHAPRLHSGSAPGLGANEFAAILERGERVLTHGQQRQVMAAANDRSTASGGHSFTFNFPSTTNPDGFRRAADQVASHVSSTLARSQARSR